VLCRHDFERTLYQSSYVSDDTLRSFHHAFVAGLCEDDTYKKHVYFADKDEIHEVEGIYKALGLPGCVGSIDGVRVPQLFASAILTTGPFATLLGLPVGLALFSWHVLLRLRQVHIPWERCPETARPIFSGKSGSPTIMFLVIVDHTGLVRHVCGPHPGTRNDITAVKMNAIVTDLQRFVTNSDACFTTRIDIVSLCT
jgi:hypothetical protein